MRLSKEQIKSVDEIGETQDGAKINHVTTKGGLHIFVKNNNGSMKILSQASHRGTARHYANLLEKGIQWHESLYKSEDDSLPGQDVIQIVESTPEAHRAMGIYNSYMAANSNSLDKYTYSESALAHLKASGLTQEAAGLAFTVAQSKLRKNMRIDKPYDDDMLRLAYTKKHNKPFPEGFEK